MPCQGVEGTDGAMQDSARTLLFCYWLNLVCHLGVIIKLLPSQRASWLDSIPDMTGTGGRNVRAQGEGDQSIDDIVADRRADLAKRQQHITTSNPRTKPMTCSGKSQQRIALRLGGTTCGPGWRLLGGA